MNKFLRLVEENRPGEDKYTVELRDVNGELIDSFEMWGTGSPFDNFDTFKREFGAPIPVEDQEGELTADAAIEAAGVANPESPVGKAVADRKKKIDAFLPKYTQATGQIK
jgi:hypothetical protein